MVPYRAWPYWLVRAMACRCMVRRRAIVWTQQFIWHHISHFVKTLTCLAMEQNKEVHQAHNIQNIIHNIMAFIQNWHYWCCVIKEQSFSTLITPFCSSSPTVWLSVNPFTVQIRKSRDYVYGKCQNKVLSTKSYLRVNQFEKKIIDKTWVMYKPLTKARNKDKNPSPPYRTIIRSSLIMIKPSV